MCIYSILVDFISKDSNTNYMFLRSIRSVLNAINFYLFVGLTVLLNILPGEAITIDGVYDGKVYLCNNEENRTVTIKFDKNENPSDYTFDWYDSKSPTTSLGTDSSKVLSVNDAENEICVKITHKGTNESNIQKFKVARSNQISIQNIYDDYKNNWLTNQNLKLCKKSSVKIHPELSNSDLSSVVYEWSKDVDKNGNKTKEKVGGNSEFLNVASPGNYHLTVSQYGCKVSKDFSISAADMVSLSGNDGLCDDEGELNLSASGMNSYEWKGNNIAPNGSSATVKETGTYTVIGKQEYNNAICWDTLTFVVKKKEALDLQVEGVTALCPGKTETSLTANVTNDDASDLDYSWSDDNGHDGSGGDLSNIGVGTYTITVSSNSGNKCPSTKVITVAKVDTVSKPQISGKLLICSGSSASLTIKNLDLATCNWYYGDSLCFVTHQGSSERAEPKWIGDYHVVGYTLGGCESKPTKFSLSKVNLPAVVLDTVKPCGDAPVSVKATYADSLTFNWGVSINKQPKSYVGTAVKNGGDYINTIEVSQTSKITAKVVDKNTSVS